ncbi:MAG: hypothetical protein EZS28_031247 [Streblomastix strix]|uniref:Uncharacterized protein n=1 Tax=Streblomastix strix TaxID=222440 RepID=A0A5J4US48_9EUKA|nr:MAG: hypothetical protein EZS28_031247 [Streblomastix strix]
MALLFDPNSSQLQGIARSQSNYKVPQKEQTQGDAGARFQHSQPIPHVGLTLSASSSEPERYEQIQDDFMDSQECEAFYDFKESVIKVVYNGRVKTVFSEQRHFDPESHQRLDAAFWGFEPERDMLLWTACILVEAALMKAKQLQDGVATSRSAPTTPQCDIRSTNEVDASRPMIALKRKRPDEAAFLEDSNISLQDQFHQEGLRWTMKQDPAKTDMLEYQLQTIQGQQLFTEIAWDGANVVFPVPEAEAALPEEKAGFARRALQSSCAVNQGLAGIIHDIARKNSNKIVNKLAKVWEASLVSVGDSYKEGESRLRGVQLGLFTEDVLSKTSKEKFKQKISAKSVTSHYSTSYHQQSKFSNHWKQKKFPNQRAIEYIYKWRYGKNFNNQRNRFQESTSSTQLDDNSNL